MENASKALIMAGAILIAIMIISLAVYLFTDFGTTSAEINKENAERQLTQFNTQFTTYLGRNNITVYELISVVNLAKENNSEYASVNNYANAENGYQINVYLDNTTLLSTKTQTDLDTYIQNTGLGETLYTCTSVTYDNQNGRIREVYFTTN